MHKHRFFWHIARALAPLVLALSAATPATAQMSPDASVMEEDAGLPDYTIYRPQTLDAGGRLLPIVVYGNGGCVHAGNRSEIFLREVAAHGYLVIAPGPIVGEAERDAVGQYHVDRLTAAIDWAIAEHGRPGSRFEGLLDTSKITAMGRSCGGLQAIVAGSDPRVSGVVVINSGIIRSGGVEQADGTVTPRSYLPGTDADLARLHTPVIYLVGGPTDQAFVNAERDFAMIDQVPVFYGNMDVGHDGTFRQAGGGAMGRAAIDWLEWQNRGDSRAARRFLGSDCQLCSDPLWTVQRKGL